MAKSNPGKKMFTVWFEQDVASRLEIAAREKKTTQSDIVRDAVRAYLAQTQVSKTADDYLDDAIACIELAKRAAPSDKSAPAPIWA